MSDTEKKPVKKEPTKKKTLTAAEKIQKQLSEDYEFKPPKNLRPPSPEEAVSQQSDHQGTQEE